MKWIIVIFVAMIILMAGFFYFGQPSSEWDEGAPTMSIALEIKKVDSTTLREIETAEVDLEINDETKPTPIWDSGKAATLVEVGIPFVEPTAQYTLEWNIEAEATPQSPSVTTITGDCFIVGQASDGRNYIGHQFPNNPTTIQVIKNNWDVSQPMTFGFNSAETTHEFFNRIDPGPDHILGADLHNSEFNITLNVHATGDPGIFGTTSVEIKIVVGAGGTIEVKILGITAIVTEN